MKITAKTYKGEGKGVLPLQNLKPLILPPKNLKNTLDNFPQIPQILEIPPFYPPQNKKLRHPYELV